MPKIKTKSGAKKRFKITGTGKVMYQQSRKRGSAVMDGVNAIRRSAGNTS